MGESMEGRARSTTELVEEDVLALVGYRLWDKQPQI